MKNNYSWIKSGAKDFMMIMGYFLIVSLILIGACSLAIVLGLNPAVGVGFVMLASLLCMSMYNAYEDQQRNQQSE